jgi:hypothetical protein
LGLNEQGRQEVRSANRSTRYVQQYRPPGQKTSVQRISGRLPVEYELPFVRSGTLVFETAGVRLAALEFDLLNA